jgi:uncharacterized membrane protein
MCSPDTSSDRHPHLNSSPAPTQRIQSVDLLRGVVIMVMALDHVRDSFHSAAMSGSPADLATTRNARASADHRSERIVGHSYKAQIDPAASVTS